MGGVGFQAKARDIFRSKGVLCINGQGKTKFVFQGVHEQINFGPSLESWKEDETPMNKLVRVYYNDRQMN